ncbi:MAG: ATP-dependent DNA helicase [Acidobacteria bacterium]|nr:ATP-dependent DNA helicase [Acidobacteriota bacterium]
MSPGDVGALFGPGGRLARARGYFEHRACQQRMAENVARAFAERRHLVVEAGTGTGKTLAYLVPALLVDEPVILSTGTKALQDQIVQRELPIALAATGREGDVVVLKGRENYLCLKRLQELGAEPRLDLFAEIPVFKALEPWSRETRTGDRAEVPGLRDASPLWAQVDGRADTCTGTHCAEYDRCFVYAARRRAAVAKVVIVNHHLLFADLALRRAGPGRILPDTPFLVLDEAHLAEEAAVQHFGLRLSQRMALDLARDARRELEQQSGRLASADEVEVAGKALFSALRPREGPGRVAFSARHAGAALQELREVYAEGLARVAEALGGDGERAEERALLVARCAAQRLALDELWDAPRAGHVVTVEPQGREGAVLAAWPIDVAPLLAETLGEVPSVVATSATLAIGGRLDRAARRLGIAEAQRVLIASPFAHRRQAVLYVPEAFPEPGSPEFPERSLREIEQLLEISRGRALVLFASHRALTRAAERLRGALAYPVLVQGEAPREILVEEFRREVHSVLLGTASFRQGIDVPGEALSLVVVDKLPFAVPDDPLVAARAALVRERGGDPFHEEQLPEAIISLRQALGRLIRSHGDRGVLALLDVRVRTRRYGRTVFESLPDWPVVSDLEQVRHWFQDVVDRD